MINNSDLEAFGYWDTSVYPALNTTNFGKVLEFHQKFCPDQISSPWSESGMELRFKLMREELKEVEDAWDDDIYDGYEEAVVKELTDLLYVTYGTLVFLGVDANEAFRRVHESNMSKLDDNGVPIRRLDGKVLKGPNYFEPNLEDLV